MTVIMQAGTIIQYKTATGAVKPGMLVRVNNPLTPTWDLVTFDISGSSFQGGVHLNVPNDETKNANNSFGVLSGSVPF
jgi:hypothetical protein